MVLKSSRASYYVQFEVIFFMKAFWKLWEFFRVPESRSIAGGGSAAACEGDEIHELGLNLVWMVAAGLLLTFLSGPQLPFKGCLKGD